MRGKMPRLPDVACRLELVGSAHPTCCYLYLESELRGKMPRLPVVVCRFGLAGLAAGIGGRCPPYIYGRRHYATFRSNPESERRSGRH